MKNLIIGLVVVFVLSVGYFLFEFRADNSKARDLIIDTSASEVPEVSATVALVPDVLPVLKGAPEAAEAAPKADIPAVAEIFADEANRAPVDETLSKGEEFVATAQALSADPVSTAQAPVNPPAPTLAPRQPAPPSGPPNVTSLAGGFAKAVLGIEKK